MIAKIIKLYLFIILLKHIHSKNILKSNIDFLSDTIHSNRELEELTIEIMKSFSAEDHGLNCVAIICDEIYLNIFNEKWFYRLSDIPYIMIVVKDSEDLLSPNFDTLESIRLVRQEGCKLYIIYLANGIQTERLLRFGDRYRVLDTRAKYILLYDFRLFVPSLHFLWKRIINVIFIKHFVDSFKDNGTISWFEMSTVPFPTTYHDVLFPRRLEIWKSGHGVKTKNLFADKTFALDGDVLNVAILEHIPGVVKNVKNETIDGFLGGIEMEIMRTVSKVMKFNPKVYEPPSAKQEQWGHKQLNGSFSGLLGEMVNGKADFALGNLHYTPYHLQLTDLSIPYITECLTFLTPESLTDNSWKTLILPFKRNMWIAVLVVLLMSGFIFYGLAKFHRNLTEKNAILTKQRHEIGTKNESQNGIYKTPSIKPVGLFLFEDLSNSILYTFGMLLVVSLPKLPTGWSIRLLTGWYWLYCVLVVVAYRASMTAILANPTPRVTIDTMKELAESKILCGGWGDQTKEFFYTSLDEIGQKIGSKFQTINDVDFAVEQVAKGSLAYYENTYFLKYISIKRKNKMESINENNSTLNNETMDSSGDRNLHIMRDCAIHMPISIGLQKNSPFKPRIDKLLRKIIEAGLIKKWLNDVTVPISSSSDEETVKAVMDLRKFYGGFVALGIGYGLSFIALIIELIHWNYIVKKDPSFDKYAIDLYYLRKKTKNIIKK